MVAKPQQHPSEVELFSSGGSVSSSVSNSNGETGDRDNENDGTDESSEAAILPHSSGVELNPVSTAAVDGNIRVSRGDEGSGTTKKKSQRRS